jgi:formate--tetrahydrofolate ligase
MTDQEIAARAQPLPIQQIAQTLGIADDHLELYGKYKAKVNPLLIDEARVKQSKLILVTAISPTPAGEGKTTVSIGLADGLKHIGKKVAVALREPSLGPVFGMKGGATGGGHSQVIPMEDINMHFTGDFSAIEKANNLLAALIDNNIQDKKRSIGIDPRTVLWKRCMDMNDRALRSIVTGLGGKPAGMLREGGFNITAASEVMAIVCMAQGMDDLKTRLGNIYIGDTYAGEPVFARQLNAQGAMAALLKEAMKPNLVQTLEGTPAFIHGGPFANIAQGTNTIAATKMAMTHADYVVTEAGFAADLGAEKFLDLKCQQAGISPRAVVIVATIRALKYHGGVPLAKLGEPSPEAVQRGFPNLEKHLETIAAFGLPAVVAINQFVTDTPEEWRMLEALCTAKGVAIAASDGWAHGGKGTAQLATLVAQVADGHTAPFRPLYAAADSALDKMNQVARTAYGARGVVLSAKAEGQLKRLQDIGLGNLPVCMAKTQKSLSDDETRIGRPTDFDIAIREFEVAAGAGFIVPVAGSIMRMPGLPSTPAAEGIDISAEGVITGLF